MIDPRQWKNVKKKVVKGRLNKKGTRKDSAIAKKTRGHLVFLQTTDLIPNRLKLTKNSRLEFASLIYFNNYKKKYFPVFIPLLKIILSKKLILYIVKMVNLLSKVKQLLY